MNILIVSQYFYPENFRINDLAKELIKRGNSVTVLTGKPNYPTGEYFEGYKYDGLLIEEWEGMKLIRVPLRARKQGSINLIRNYCSFVKNANKYIRVLSLQKFDVIYVFEVSPITVALPAIKLKKRTNTPIIMNVQDLWPDNIIAVTGIDNFIINFLITKLVRYIYQHVDIILAASPSFVPKIQDIVTGKKVKYWPQYSTVSKSNLNQELFNKNDTNIVFTGNIGEAQGIDLAIYAANQLRNTNIKWHFIGDGRNKDQLQHLVNKLNLENKVFFYGFKAEKEIPLYLNEADAALLILKPSAIFDLTIPAKLQTYLACGVPIIGCVSGEGKKIVEEAKCGLVSNNITVDDLVKICIEFINLEKSKIDDFKENSLNYAKKNFSKEKLINQLISEMEELK